MNEYSFPPPKKSLMSPFSASRSLAVKSVTSRLNLTSTSMEERLVVSGADVLNEATGKNRIRSSLHSAP